MSTPTPTASAGLTRWGDGDPTAVLVHGGGSAASTWWRVGPALAAATGGTVLAPDLPGHGSSAVTTRPLTLAALVGAVGRLAGEAGPVDLLVGHSLGAVVVLELAAADPSVAKRLVLEEPASMAGVDPRLVAALTRRDALVAGRDPAEYARVDLQMNPDWLPEDARGNAEAFGGCDVEALRELLAGLDYDLVELARGVPNPTLVLWADGGRSSIPPPQREPLMAALGQSRAVELPTGHAVHRGRTGEYVRLLVEWLAADRRRDPGAGSGQPPRPGLPPTPPDECPLVALANFSDSAQSVGDGLLAAAGLGTPEHVQSTAGTLELDAGRIRLPAWGFLWLTSR